MYTLFIYVDMPITSECKALWGEPEPAPFFVCAHAFALIGTRDAVHVRM